MAENNPYSDWRKYPYGGLLAIADSMFPQAEAPTAPTRPFDTGDTIEHFRASYPNKAPLTNEEMWYLSDMNQGRDIPDLANFESSIWPTTRWGGPPRGRGREAINFIGESMGEQYKQLWDDSQIRKLLESLGIASASERSRFTGLKKKKKKKKRKQ